MLNGRAANSPEVTLRLQAWLDKDRGGNAGLWLRIQGNDGLWQATQKSEAAPMRVQRAPLAV